MPEKLRIPSADAVLDATDHAGPDPAVVLLNGAFGTQRDWNRVITALGGTYRIISFDERARGRSTRSSDYSFAGCLEDLDAVLATTGLTGTARPILVGWSYGAAVAVRYAADHPDAVTGLVLIDGAFPISMQSAEERAKTRSTFRKMGPLMRLLALFGRSTTMSPDEAATVNIELDDVLGQLGPAYDRITCPVRFLIASTRHPGATDEQLRTMRAAIDPVIAAHPNITVDARLPCSHLQILSKYPDSVVTAIQHAAPSAPTP
ncbi:alpha/beta fold hydrolase [Streptosporangium sp. CA-115845]|uniref:alpha/beta fold hydrolase n=1 Tax=Streptosporangium sp. CA-115845 TaxID=3240071 RepID=UPI003D94115D